MSQICIFSLQMDTNCPAWIMDQNIQEFVKKTLLSKEIYNPVFFRLKIEDDKKKFNSLIESTNVFLYDEIHSQLRELIKSRNPRAKFTTAEYQKLIDEHLHGCSYEEYGVWVYYPWSAKLVHILDEIEFVELRTSANRNKITKAEQDILATKKIGVIGLSVGQSVSLTLALERGCGELRLADFDTIELNNLNRIRTGVYNLGLLKVYSVAREIAEIDPFFKVVCYPEGILEENIEKFFTSGGKLNAVIDECDGVNIKILCRIKAKELNIPVIMEASDRGTIDVERFDLEPDRPIIHGWLDHLTIDFNVLNKLRTSEEKLPYMVPISGLESLSPRMKASMVEIEQTITTWPQLATAVTLGGALTADTCRRILLDQFTNSGRYFIDLEKLIADTRPKKELEFPVPPAELDIVEMNEIAERAANQLNTPQIIIKPEDIVDLVTAAITAPSAGNNQPWKWLYHNSNLFLFHEKSRTLSFGDFKDIASYLGLGAALENLELCARQKNIGTVLHLFPLQDTNKLVAAIQFSAAVNDTLYQPQKLVRYIHERFTNRNLGERTPIAPKIYDSLKKAVSSVPGAELIIKSHPGELDEFADIIGAADRLRLLHPDGHYEFYNKELRWDSEHSRVTADGIDISTVDISPSEVVGLKLVKDPLVSQLLVEWRAGKGLERVARKSIAAASAVGLVLMPQFSSLDYLLGGRAVQRLWLSATEHSVSLQPMVAATLHFARLNHGNGEGMPDFMKEEFKILYKRFEQLIPEIKGREEVFLFRLCMAEKPSVRSYRYALDKVLVMV